MAKYDPNEATNPARNLKRREDEAGTGEQPSRITEVDQATTRTPGTMSQSDFLYGRGGMDKPKPAPKHFKRMYSPD